MELTLDGGEGTLRTWSSLPAFFRALQVDCDPSITWIIQSCQRQLFHAEAPQVARRAKNAARKEAQIRRREAQARELEERRAGLEAFLQSVCQSINWRKESNLKEFLELSLWLDKPAKKGKKKE